MQYLVSVIDDTTGSATGNEMAAIDAFNDRLRADGQWVFAAGLASPSTATVIDNRGEEPVFTDGLPGVEGVPRRLLDHGGRRPRRGAQARCRGVEGMQPEGRGTARSSASELRGEIRRRCRIGVEAFVGGMRGCTRAAARRRRRSKMTQYLIAFNDGDMTFPEEELPDVAKAAQAVVREATEAGVWVFGAGAP